MKNFLSVLVLVLFFSSCYYDNIDEMHPEVGLIPDCIDDTTSVTYSKDIQPLLLTNCGSQNNNCHQTSNNGNKDISLATYTDVSGITSSQLLSCITWDDPDYTRMPYGGSKLSDCKINKIAAWIHQGYLQ